MIDPADQQTQALPLDEQTEKKRRGRPATGKAMTPAEKQRAYRERQKSNVTEIEELREKARVRGRCCVEQARMIQELEAKLAEAIARAEKAEKAEKANKGNVAEKVVKGMSYRKLTEAAFDQLKTNEKRADKKTASDWSFGTFLLWDSLAPWMNVQKAAYEADKDKMRQMVGLDPKAPK